MKVLSFLFLIIILLASCKKEEQNTGWIAYINNSITEQNPDSLNLGDTLRLNMREASTLRGFAPNETVEFFDNSSSKIITELGASYDVRIDIMVKSESNTNYINLILDIGGTQGIILSRIESLPRGLGVWHSVSMGFSIYSLDTFVKNGGSIYISSAGLIKYARPAVFIKKDYHPKE